MESVSLQTSDVAPAQTQSPAINAHRMKPPRAASQRDLPENYRAAPPRRAEKWLLRQALAAIGNPPFIMVLWNGEEIAPAAMREIDPVRVVVADRRTLWLIIVDPFFQFPEAYSDGRVTIEGDLERLMCLIGEGIAQSTSGTQWFAFVERMFRWSRRNTLAGSRANIHHHYDIGNEFYRLWLCENLLYTCAYFEQPTVSLEQAQCAKMDHVCRKLMLRPGEMVIEAGCGWGGFALHMARQYGVRVRAYNISHEQIDESRRRARQEGLNDRVEFVLEDWRNITGACDAFVSVGMLEHVGVNNYRRLGDVMHRCLGANGRGLIHSIGRNRRQPLDAWIERRIFPGACPPSLGQMSDLFERQEFSVLDVENLRLHYAETLRHWLARFEQSAEVVDRMYDSQFVRMWRMYLAGSVAAFETGSLQLFQVLFARPGVNHLPMTRECLYAHGEQSSAPFWGQR